MGHLSVCGDGEKRVVVHSPCGVTHAYGVVSPVRDEAESLGRLAAALSAQTLPPRRWVIVDNGSTDETRAVAEEIGRHFSWVTVLSLPGLPKPTRGAPVVEAFEFGLAELPDVDVVVKVDADVSMEPDFFAGLLREFDADPRLGIASGSRYERRNGRWQREHLTGTGVEPMCRLYRFACLVEVLPLERHMGWDGIDEARANLLGWTTRAFAEPSFRHHRSMGRRDGARVRAWIAHGSAAHYMGYRPTYLLARTIRKSVAEPSAFGLLLGYSSSAARRRERCSDQAIRAYVREQQRLRRLPQRVRESFGRGTATVLRKDLLLVAGGGGHFLELLALRAAWEGFEVAWVTLADDETCRLVAPDAVYPAYGPTSRSAINLIRNLVVASKLVRQLRPRIVLTTGGGVSVPFAWVGRLFGARVVYVEISGATRLSLSLRLVRPVAAKVFVQWPDLAQSTRYEYAGSVLGSEGITRILKQTVPRQIIERSEPGVFVTVGNSDAPFDRLVACAEELAGQRVFVQAGRSRLRPRNTSVTPFVSFAESVARIRSARVVVAHAGCGTVNLATALGKRAIVVPRRKAFGEAVDDHQLAYAKRLHAAGLVTLVEDPTQIPAFIDQDQTLAPLKREDGLVAHLRDVIACLLADGDAVR